MYSCIVRKPDGAMSFFLAMEDDSGNPQIPTGWTLIMMTPWTPVSDESEYSLSCAGRNESGNRISLR